LHQPAFQVLQAFLDAPLLGIKIVARDHEPLQGRSGFGCVLPKFGQLVSGDCLYARTFRLQPVASLTCFAPQ
jgi:hypothetical protein